MISLTYIPRFSVKFFFQPIYIDYGNIDKRSNLNILLRNCWTKFGWNGPYVAPFKIMSNSPGLH